MKQRHDIPPQLDPHYECGLEIYTLEKTIEIVEKTLREIVAPRSNGSPTYCQNPMSDIEQKHCHCWVCRVRCVLEEIEKARETK